MGITNMANAFLVRLSSGVWTARKMDKAATKEARETAGASLKAGVKVYKSVIAADALDKVAQITTAARNEHRKRTVPWTYEGVGAITAEGYAPYKDAMAQYAAEFKAAVSHFLSVYEGERAKARDYLGSMFNETDYPTVGALQEKFYFATHAEPMPTATAFDVQGLAIEHVTAIKNDIAVANAHAFVNANKAAWDRVTEAVDKLKTRLEEYTSGVVTKFYDSWIDNIKEVADMIPSINVAGDKVLSGIAVQLQGLTAYSPDRLKDSAVLRSAIAKQAAALLEQIGEAKHAA
jgi:hypothetical protein